MLSFKKIDKMYLWMVKLIVFAIPFIPLLVSSSTIFPFITGKNFAFRILVEIAAVFWIGLIVAKSEYRIRNSPILLSILVFTFIVGLADLTGINPYSSFWSNFERMEGYITILHLILYFMILQSVFKRKKDWHILFCIVLLVSVLVSFFPLLNSFKEDTLTYRRFTIEYGTREFSTLGNPPFLASYLLLASFIGLILSCNTKKLYLKAGCFIAISVNVTAIYFTATRGVILPAIAGAAILVSFYMFRSSNKSSVKVLKTIVLLCIVIITIAGALFIYSDSELIKHDQTLSRFTSMLTSDSARTRLDVWKMAWNGVKERPILGWGQENFVGIYTVNPIVSLREHSWLDRAHNILLEWLVSAGILGLFSYLAIFASAFVVLRKAYKNLLLTGNEVVIIVTALVVYFAQNLFTFDTISTYMIFFALLAYIENSVMFENQTRSETEQGINMRELKIRSIAVALAVLLCFSFIFYYINYKPLRQSSQIIGVGFTSPEDDSYSMLLKDLNEILSIDSFGNSVVRRGMLTISFKILKMQQFEQEGALEFLQATVNELQKDILIYGYDLEYMTDIINFFNQIALYEKSFVNISESLIKRTMNINREYYWLNMAMADVNVLKKNYDAAFDNVKRIADLFPADEEKQFKLALMAVYSSRDEVAEQALKRVGQVRLSKDRNILDKRRSFLSLSETYQLAQVYRNVKQYDIALHYYKEIITVMSEEKIYFDQDVLYYLPKTKARVMAQIYLDLDDLDASSKEAEKALEIDSDLSDAKTLIESINNGI